MCSHQIKTKGAAIQCTSLMLHSHAGKDKTTSSQKILKEERKKDIKKTQNQ